MFTIRAFNFNPFQENTYLLYNAEGSCVIVDPGCEAEWEEKVLSDYIQDHSLTPKLLLLTHGHIDHILGLDFVYRTWGLKPWIHRADEYMLNTAITVASRYGLRYKGHHGVEGYLDDLQAVNFEGKEWPILHTPGHSQGSVSILLPEEKQLLAGDVLFYRSVGRSDFPESNPSDLTRSIREKLYELPDDTTVLPGHGPVTLIGDEKLQNPFVRKS